ncbi:hypothetical protein PAXINDRAFT_15577 [Paxillus involutus ATCC 200175]|uniref:Uncharacterized protein n=1 Tax=Paxillus involutus ATCC 200175 TaxID=664439 RepID=A0A0C9TV07_PAXIN|nr:hypothetical protein PAXINDRAFT_15577 [Paxillus involutus ATCC 200175]
MPNQSRLIQIYVASKRRISGFALVNHTNAFNRTVPSVESTEEWRSEWETWMGGLFRALEDTKEQGDCLEIPYDVSQAIAMAEVAYTNLEGRAEAERARELRGGRRQVEVEEGSSQVGGKGKRGEDRHV